MNGHISKCKMSLFVHSRLQEKHPRRGTRITWTNTHFAVVVIYHRKHVCILYIIFLGVALRSCGFLKLPVSSLNISITPIKTQHRRGQKKLNSPFVAGHLSLPPWIQCTYPTENTCTGRPVSRADTYLEDLLQFAHDFYHLRVINTSLCWRSRQETSDWSVIEFLLFSI